MSRPIIALLTDFGTRDHYAGTMKGVVLGLCPDATLVDISHDIPAHDVLTGALELAACYRYFPAGTIFLVVVDPGVGSTRRGLAAETADYRFVAPDNGVLSAVFAETPPRTVVELTDRQYARPSVSRTFEGRDRFAPAAAWLARGTRVSALGRPAADYRRLELPEAVVAEGVVQGTVVQVDRFGNLISNIDRRTFERLAGAGGLEIEVDGHAVAALVTTYADVPSGTVAALFGSRDRLEIAANAASAAVRLGAGRGSVVRVRRT
jgi:S-adenosylmethionine hydrolase